MDDVLRQLWIRNSQLYQASADNAVATITVAASRSLSPGADLKFYFHQIYADYDAAVALIKKVTLIYTLGGSTVTDVYHPNFTLDEFLLGTMRHTDVNTTVVCTLEASGTGGITGFIKLLGFYA